MTKGSSGSSGMDGLVSPVLSLTAKEPQVERFPRSVAAVSRLQCRFA